MSIDTLADWTGRSKEALDIASIATLNGVAAMLDHTAPPWPPGKLPPLAHWFHFVPQALQRDLSPDGHPHMGGFMPPISLPRRMWAGSDVKFTDTIQIGEAIRQRSSIASVQPKSGRTGNLVFVTVAHEVFTARGLALRETQDIVYREATSGPNMPPPGEAPTAKADWEDPFQADPALLFRFSALTFNSHRIHYDRPYALGVEGYPGLVVHGPLLATLLMDRYLRHNPGTSVIGFQFRARRPVIDINPFSICGKARADGADLWIKDSEGCVAMTATVEAKSA